MNSHYFCIGGHRIGISFADATQGDGMHLLPSFGAFRSEEGGEEGLLLRLTVDPDLRPARDRKLVRKFDTGNGDTLVYQLPDGGYQYIIRDTHDRDCCLLITNADFSQCRCALNGDWTMRSFGLNDALMLAYAFAGSFRQTLLVHASCVVCGQRAYPFIAASGTGKSTHTALWLKHIEGAQLLNDDNPVVRIGADGQPRVYGSPWSGKTPCYRNQSAPLGAVTRIERAPANSIERLGPVAAFASLLPACSSMKWDERIYDNLCQTITRIVETTPVFTLHCLPDEAAARLSHQAIAAQ
ncbi:MAG: hypothetical protein IJ841_09865 [Prevotella sp.]|nr:hypothetical protein [Prevotella sp.]